MNGFNPMMLLKMMQGKNPKDFVMNMVQNQMPNNPIVNNMMNLANNGDKAGVEAVARNLFKEKGLNFDKEFTSFMSNFKK